MSSRKNSAYVQKLEVSLKSILGIFNNLTFLDKVKKIQEDEGP
jgi:hypothetical protein